MINLDILNCKDTKNGSLAFLLLCKINVFLSGPAIIPIEWFVARCETLTIIGWESSHKRLTTKAANQYEYIENI